MPFDLSDPRLREDRGVADATHLHLHPASEEQARELLEELGIDPEEISGDPLAKLTNICDAMMGEADGRRRQHSRDSRAVPLPSEISSAFWPNRRATQADLDECCTPGTPPLGNGPRPSQVVLDGAAALRERAIAERAALGDLQAEIDTFWQRQSEADRLKRR
jgi:hypothetical protein